MTSEHSPLERILERTARAVGGGGLHPAELLERIQAAYLAGADNGLAPNRLSVVLHPDDYRAFAPAFSTIRDEVVALVREVGQRSQLRHIGQLMIEFDSDDAAARGLVAVRASFADTTNRPAFPAPLNATSAFVRHVGVDLVVNGGERVALTHTPFTIGRGPGNDLVVPSLAVSRHHARILSGAEGFQIEDLGGRNGVVINGVRQTLARLMPGTRVVLGDTTIELRERR